MKNFKKILSTLFFVFVFCSQAQAMETNKTDSEEIVVEFGDLPNEIFPFLMNFLSLPDEVHLCVVDCQHMLFLPLVFHKRISDGTLNPTQLCDCLIAFSSYLRCAKKFTENKRGYLVATIAPYAIQAAQQNISHENCNVQRDAFFLFKALFEHSLGFAETLQSAKQYITHEHWWPRVVALILFRALIKNIQHCPTEQLRTEIISQATQVDQQNIAYEYWRVRKAVLILFKVLIKNIQHCQDEQLGVQIISQAIQAAQQYIIHEHWGVRVAALDLFRALFQHNQAFAEAFQDAQQYITYEYYEAALYLFWALIKNIQHCPDEQRRDQIIFQAIQAAQQYIAHHDWGVKVATLYLFRALVHYSLGFAEAFQAAQRYITSEYDDLRVVALDLFRALVKKIQHCPEEELRALIISQATQATQQNINHVFGERRDLSHLLQGALKKIGYSNKLSLIKIKNRRLLL